MGEWTRKETDILLALCNDFGTRWSLIIDRYHSCKPLNRPNRTMTEIKDRYYHCHNLILSFLSKDKNKSNELFHYDAMREEQRRKELTKLFMRSHDENIEISQTAQYYRKHNKLLKKKVNELHQKKVELKKQSLFIMNRQQMTSQQISEMRQKEDGQSLPFGQYHGFGVTIHDMLVKKNKYNRNEIKMIELPNKCIPKKITKIRRNIQMIDDEYTKYKYELKWDDQKTIIVPFPFIEKTNNFETNNNSKKNKNKNMNNNSAMKKNEQLLSSNPNLGKEIAKNIQQQLVKDNIISIDKYTGTPKMNPMTNTTRAMAAVLREDYIKYYAMQTLINDLKKKQNIK